ncbi:MAG: hypothetical protein AAGD00_06460 [Planctomycetota bacterium]
MSVALWASFALGIGAACHEVAKTKSRMKPTASAWTAMTWVSISVIGLIYLGGTAILIASFRDLAHAEAAIVSAAPLVCGASIVSLAITIYIGFTVWQTARAFDDLANASALATLHRTSATQTNTPPEGSSDGV